MTDLERVELALHRAKTSLQDGTEIALFINRFLRELQLLNREAFDQARQRSKNDPAI